MLELESSFLSLSLQLTARHPGKHANTVIYSLSPKIFITSQRSAWLRDQTPKCTSMGHFFLLVQSENFQAIFDVRRVMIQTFQH
jgi:hypothetical protein